MLIDHEQISEKDLERINKYTRKDLTKDDIYAFEVILCNNQIDKDFEMISTDCLYDLRKISIGSTGILTENKTAKIFDSYCRAAFDNDGKAIVNLKAKAYIPKTCIEETELKNILTNQKIGIGFAVKNKICSICRNNFDFCGHHKGQKYDNRLCYAILYSPTDFYEWAVVSKSNDEKSKTHEVSEMKTKTQLKINGEIKDVEIENGEITIIEPEKKVTGWERGDLKKIYYMVDGKSFHDNYDEDDASFYNCANYFNDKKLAENISRMQTLQRKMFRWQTENDVPINFNDAEQEIIYEIYYDYVHNEILCDETNYCVCGFIPYFSTEEKAKECIEVFEDELKWLFTEFKWRMDGD